jgi:hypothetical protein
MGAQEVRGKAGTPAQVLLQLSWRMQLQRRRQQRQQQQRLLQLVGCLVLRLWQSGSWMEEQRRQLQSLT